MTIIVGRRLGTNAGVTWSCSSGEEEDDLDVVDPNHDDTPHKVPHLLPTITPR
jgi:hypothetical protein